MKFLREKPGKFKKIHSDGFSTKHLVAGERNRHALVAVSSV